MFEQHSLPASCHSALFRACSNQWAWPRFQVVCISDQHPQIISMYFFFLAIPIQIVTLNVHHNTPSSARSAWDVPGGPHYSIPNAPYRSTGSLSHFEYICTCLEVFSLLSVFGERDYSMTLIYRNKLIRKAKTKSIRREKQESWPPLPHYLVREDRLFSLAFTEEI